MKATLVLSSWSSGSTSLVGYLEKCGAFTCPPHFFTNDYKRTPNSYEPKEYINELIKYVDTNTLTIKKDLEEFKFFFAKWIKIKFEESEKNNCKQIVLKHPLQIFLLNQINEICDTQYVVITRPLKEIEATRIRRNWHKVFGSFGAKILYNKIYSFLHENNKSYITVSYNQFRVDKQVQNKLLNFVDLNPSKTQLELAEKWLR